MAEQRAFGKGLRWAGGRHARRRALASVAAVAAAALVLTGCTAEGVDQARSFDELEQALPDTTTEQLDAVLAQAVQLSGSSGAIAGVWAPWSGTWERAVGTVGFDEGAAKVTTDTSFHLAGVTTEITCTILLQLVDHKVVALDDPVTDYVPSTPGIDGVTLGQLCQQTSGLADFAGNLRPHFASNPERNWSEGELISSGLASDRVGAPGERWSPSQAGIMLLALALRNATGGRDWNSLAEDYVFGPLGMDHTTLPAPDDVEHDDILGAYAPRNGPDGALDCSASYDDSRQSSSMGGAAAGAISTLDDVQRLSEAFATGALLEEATTRAQWDLVPLGGDAPTWQGYGMGGSAYGPMRGTAGETAGALTAAFTDPGSGLTVVVALNDSTSGAAFVREVAFALASIASKSEAVSGQERPLIELPWSLEQATTKMVESAPCPTPVEAPVEEPAEEAPAEAPAEEAPAEG